MRKNSGPKKINVPMKNASLVEVDLSPKKAEPPPMPIPAQAPAPEPPALNPNEHQMEPHDTALIQLANERIANAQLHLQARTNEFNSLVAQVRAKYEEDGKYQMTALDVARGVVTRHPRKA